MFKFIKLIFAVLSIVGAMLALGANYAAHAQTTAFTYQGRLTDNSLSPTGTYDFQFKIYTAATGGAQQGFTVTKTAVPVTNGVFTVQIDMSSSPFVAGDNRYLEIAVRLNGSGAGYTPLAPRQQITSAPYAVQSVGAAFAVNAQNAAALGNVPANQFVQTTDSRLTDARTPTSGSDFYVQNNATTAQPNTSFNIGGNGKVGGTFTAGSVSAGSYRNQFSNVILQTNIAGSTYLGDSAGGLSQPLAGSNTFLGNLSGDSNTSGSGNTFVGRRSGSGNATGGNNTAIGNNAVLTTNNLNFAAAIGANSAVNTDDTIVLGKVAGTYNGVSRPADSILIPGDSLIGGTLNAFNAGVSNNLSVQGNLTTQGTFNVVGASSMTTLTVNNNLTAGNLTGNGGNLTGLNGSSITFGTVNANRIAPLNANKITSGTLDDSILSTNIPRKNASNTFAGNLEANDILANGNLGTIGSLSVGGTFFGTTVNATTFSGTTINAATQYNIGGNPVISVGFLGLINIGRPADIISINNLNANTLTFGSLSGNTVNANTVDATTQFNINGNRVLSASGNVVTVGRATDTTKVGILQITGGSDLAEKFEIADVAGEEKDSPGAADAVAVKPGMVVAIDPNRAGKLAVSRQAYDRRVAGVISGANNVAAGMILPDLAEGKNSRAVALSGRVWVYADATCTPIQPGDLLTTSDTPGHAMRADDASRSQGAILGKAMTELKSGTGLVLILVTLQ